MSKSENLLAFEVALRESQELQKKFVEVQKRIVENKEANSDGELLVKIATELGFILTMEELERGMASHEDLSDEELDQVSGGTNGVSCWKDYACEVIYMHDSTSTSHACFGDYLCDVIYHDGAFSVLASLFY